MNAYEKLHRKAMRHGITVAGAIAWLDKRYTGNGIRAFRWAMHAAPAEIENAMRLRAFYAAIPKHI